MASRPVTANHAPARPPGRGGAFALFTVVVCLAAQVAGIAHLGLVNHVRCVEHDALVHSSGRAHDAATPPERLAVAQGVPADVETHGDDHCLAGGLRRREDQLVPIAGTDLPPPTFAEAFVAPAAARLAARPPVPLLSIAPKSGPPARA